MRMRSQCCSKKALKFRFTHFIPLQQYMSTQCKLVLVRTFAAVSTQIKGRSIYISFRWVRHFLSHTFVQLVVGAWKPVLSFYLGVWLFYCYRVLLFALLTAVCGILFYSVSVLRTAVGCCCCLRCWSSAASRWQALRCVARVSLSAIISSRIICRHLECRTW